MLVAIGVASVLSGIAPESRTKGEGTLTWEKEQSDA